MTVLLSTTELAYMRDSARAAMTNTATRLTRTDASDGAGGVTTTYGTSGTAIACRLASVSLSTRSNAEGERFTVHNVMTLTVPYDQAIATTDQWVVTGVVYSVVAIDDVHDWITARRAQVVVEK